MPTTLEQNRQASQVAIDGARTFGERNRTGQFSTPYSLAIDIVRSIKPLVDREIPNIAFGEPACGSGAFFSALLDTFPKNRITEATGIEIDADFANAARQLWEHQGLRVVEGDFTKRYKDLAELTKPNLIIANPPYVRHHHIGTQQKQRLMGVSQQITGISVNGLAGLYVYFILLSHEWLAENGIAVWLIPSEFMDVNYGMALRTYFTDIVTLISIHRFDPADVQFDDALVSSAVVVFKKCRPSVTSKVLFSYGGKVSAPTTLEQVPIADLRTIRKWTSLPHRHGQRVRSTLSSPELTLGDLFKVKRGIATGGNNFFILPRSKTVELGLPPEALKPVLPSPRHLKETILERGLDGYPEIAIQLSLLDTDLTEDVIADRFPKLRDYLATAVQKGIMDGYLVKGRKPWYRQEQRPRAPFLCTYMGRGSATDAPFRFIWNKSDATVTNVYLMLFPKGPLAELLRNKPELEVEIFALLNAIAPHDLCDEGRVYGGGLRKIEPSELANIPADSFASRFPGLIASRQTQLVL